MKPEIYYYSLTGNTKAFAERFKAEGYGVKQLEDYDLLSPFILFTPTYNFGKVPEEVATFIESNFRNTIGVVAFGNRNWGDNFANAGRVISSQYPTPLIGEVEMRGTDEDFERILLALNQIGGDR